MSVQTDPYLIPGTNVLRNLAGITDGQQLTLFENELVTIRYSELTKIPLKAEGTVVQLQWIHHYLFQDVYEWAGQIRTIDMSKGGGSVFQPLQLFTTGVQYAETMLQKDHMLQGLNREQFVERLCVNFDNFNTLHPFREGNGRAQRVFWTFVARDAGWGLDWSQVGKRENDYASYIAHENVDYTLLEAMFNKIVAPLPLEQDRHLLPAIGFKSDEESQSGEPNMYQVLTDKEYAQQRERYKYQTESTTKTRKTVEDVRKEIKSQTTQLKENQVPLGCML
jgi:cell filamentation protein